MSWSDIDVSLGLIGALIGALVVLLVIRVACGKQTASRLDLERRVGGTLKPLAVGSLPRRDPRELAQQVCHATKRLLHLAAEAGAGAHSEEVHESVSALVAGVIAADGLLDPGEVTFLGGVYPEFNSPERCAAWHAGLSDGRYSDAEFAVGSPHLARLEGVVRRRLWIVQFDESNEAPKVPIEKSIRRDQFLPPEIT